MCELLVCGTLQAKELRTGEQFKGAMIVQNTSTRLNRAKRYNWGVQFTIECYAPAAKGCGGCDANSKKMRAEKMVQISTILERFKSDFEEIGGLLRVRCDI